MDFKKYSKPLIMIATLGVTITAIYYGTKFIKKKYFSDKENKDKKENKKEEIKLREPKKEEIVDKVFQQGVSNIGDNIA